MRRALLGLAALWLAACPRDDARRSTALPQLPRSWHYDVRFDEGLEHADAKLCFEGARPRELRAGVDAAAPFLESAFWLSPGPVRKLPVREGKVQLEGRPTEGCLRYRVDLARASGQGLRLAMRNGDDLLASPALWLWRPERRARAARASLRLQLPPGVHASTPWPLSNGRAVLDAADFRYRAYAAFGPNAPRTLQQHGTTLHWATVGPPLALTEDEMRHWLGAVVAAVSDVLGRFPTEHVQLLAVNVGAARGPVVFGTVGRGGGASVLVFVSGQAEAEALTRDWVLPHELSHLLLPYVDRDDAWLPEGIATYYQEVLRARAGLKSERAAWGALRRSMTSATRWGTGRSLGEESRDMHRTGAYRRVYWAGAAFALLVDARLRHASGGDKSLDEAIRDAAWWREPPRTWSAGEVLAALDESSGMELGVPLVRTLLPSSEFPDVAPLFDKLGVQLKAGRVVLEDDAPWADVRRAIMTPRAAPAPP